MSGILILARHHESEWNKVGRWQGLQDIHLTEYGVEKSKEMGGLIKGIKIDKAYCSELSRTRESLKAMLAGAEQTKLEVIEAREINERDYGEYTGLNKWEIQKKVGDEEFKNIRRGWGCPIPGGEMLSQVYERAMPFFLKEILPAINQGQNILIVAHGNSLRTLVKYIENISDEKICDVDFPFGGVLFYTLDNDGHIISKEVKNIESQVNA